MKLFELHIDGRREPVVKTGHTNTSTVTFDAAKHYRTETDSNFLKAFLPKGVNYCEIFAKADDTGLDYKEAQGLKREVIATMINVANQGMCFPSFPKSTPDQTKERHWTFFYGQSNDEDGHRMWLVERKPNQKPLNIADIEMAILQPDLFDKDGRRLLNNYLYAKTADRILEHFTAEVPWEDGEGHGQATEAEITIVEDRVGKKFAVVNHLIKKWDAKKTALVDGAFRVHPDLLKWAGDPHYGKKYRKFGSCFTRSGLFKGDAIPTTKLGMIKWNDEFVPIWLAGYGAKKRAVFNKFFFGILQEIHPEPVKSDMQSLINFDGYRWFAQRAIDVMLKALDSLKDEDKLRGTMMPVVQKTNSAKGRKDEEVWSLQSALEIGHSMEGGLFSRMSSAYIQEAINASEGRIDLSAVATRLMADVDPFMFDDVWGIPNRPSVIRKGCVVAVDVPMPFGKEHIKGVGYRQPNGMCEERFDVDIIHDERFKDYTRCHLLFFGEDAGEHLEKVNGGDLDDHIVLFFDAEIVKMMRRLKYPVTSKIEDKSDTQKKETVGDQAERKLMSLFFGTGYGPQTFINGMKATLAWRMKIGQAVNLIMRSTLSSGKHRKNMLKDLRTRIATAREQIKAGVEDHEDPKFLAYCAKKLREFPEHPLAHEATNLEGIIDFLIQNKDLGQRDVLVAMLERMSTVFQERDDDGNVIIHLPVYPKLWAMKGRNRIPKGQVEGVDYVLAPSLLCDEITKVETLVETLRIQLQRFEFQTIRPVPEALDMAYPESDGLREVTNDLRSWLIEGYKSKVAGISDREERSAAERRLLDELTARLNEFSRGGQIAIAVDAKRVCHRLDAEVRDTGVPDYLWANNVMFSRYRWGLEKHGLAGEYVGVELAPHCQDLFGKVVETIVKANRVYRATDYMWIGNTVRPVEDWTYTMMPWGYLEVKKPDASIMRADAIDFGAIDVFGNAVTKAAVVEAKRCEALANVEEAGEAESDIDLGDCCDQCGAPGGLHVRGCSAIQIEVKEVACV